MNKTAIKNFAIWARNKLIADIKYKAGLMGITEKGIAGALPQSAGDTEFYDIGTSEPYCISGKEIEQRRRLKEVIENKAADTDYATAYKYVIEEVAYTWFNRLIAVRFMEVNDYLPGHIRVLSSETGKMEPDLVTTPFDAELVFTSSEEERIIQLKQDNKIDELFRMLFIKQCNALNELLPALFEKTNDYTEILLTLSVIDQEGVVYRLVHDIPEEDFDVNRGGQVEIIGWLYQYYNTEPKNEAFAKKGKITKEEIPAVTQLFTPDWIVRYMVENSLGRLWLEGHPDDTLKAKWKYYLDEAEQDPEVQEKLDEIREEYKKLNPEDIKLIDPCMGSGHILVYAFDVLMQIYESVGWSQRDAAKSIIENNIYGLDIDDRAFQMAYFAVMMKARQYDRRIFTRDIKPNVYAIEESNGINRGQLKYFGADLSPIEKNKAKLQVSDLLDTMIDAKEYGSILNVENYDWELLQRFSESIDNVGQMSLDTIGIDQTQVQLLALIEIAHVMEQKYEVVVTNPPYMGSSGMSANLSKYVKDKYSDSKSDLFAVFIERCGQMTAKNFYQAMITQHAWMFLSSFEKLRTKLLMTDIVNMAHLGARAFEEISGEVVQTTSFVLRKSHTDYTGTYCRLIEPTTQQGKEDMFLVGENRYTVQQSNFSKIPGARFGYWITDKLREQFSKKKISEYADTRRGLQTGNSNMFIRNWYEVSCEKAELMPNRQSKYSEKKWYLFNSGGAFRRWYGNIVDVVNWETNGADIKATGKAIIPSEDRYFDELVSWNKISSGMMSVRYQPAGIIPGDASPFYHSMSQDRDIIWYVMAVMNSKVTAEIVKVLSPTLNFEVGNIAEIPIDLSKTTKEIVLPIVEKNIFLSKFDWDSYEISWAFEEHPLVKHSKGLLDSTAVGATMHYYYKGHLEVKCPLELCFMLWQGECNERFKQLKDNEEELNRIFIDIYGLQDELIPEVDDKDVTVRKADLGRDIRSLLSYAVGCMFGRYSLDYEGLAYAGGTFDDSKYSTFIPDVDGIIPITDEEYLEDDIVGLFCAWLKKVYGEETLEENLDFIAKALGKKGNSSREIIRNYFLTDFYKDHCSTYSVTGSGKRPIYWLFDSGKQNGFKALIYLHRYTPDTIGNLRVDYLHRMQRIYESEMNRMQDMIEHSMNSREVATASKRKEKLQKQLKECREYDEKISHLALDRIELDLDDGVKYNYRKIQTGRDGKFYEVLADSKSIMMDAKKYADFKK